MAKQLPWKPISSEEKDVVPVPDSFLKLCHSAEIRNNNDAAFTAVHYAMLEMDFITLGFEKDKSRTTMPENFRKNGLFEIKYYHICFPETVCRLVAVPMSQVLVLHGEIPHSGIEVDVSRVMDLNVKKEIRFEDNVSSCIDFQKMYRNFPALLLEIKRCFVYLLLCDVYENSEIQPRFTLGNLSNELKYHILSYSDAEDLVAVSQMNKEFNNLANLPELWKRLFIIDFPHCLPKDFEEQDDWKESYKTEYVKRNERNKLMLPRLRRRRGLGQDFYGCSYFPRYHFRTTIARPVNPFQINPIHVPPQILDAFPQLNSGSRFNLL